MYEVINFITGFAGGFYLVYFWNQKFPDKIS